MKKMWTQVKNCNVGKTYLVMNFFIHNFKLRKNPFIIYWVASRQKRYIKTNFGISSIIMRFDYGSFIIYHLKPAAVTTRIGSTYLIWNLIDIPGCIVGLMKA